MEALLSSALLTWMGPPAFSSEACVYATAPALSTVVLVLSTTAPALSLPFHACGLQVI